MSDETEQYIFECQSNPDDTITLRIMEYATQEALRFGKSGPYGLEITIPRASVLYLRSKEDTPDEMQVTVNTPGGSVYFPVPIMKMQKYDLEQIFEKRLYFLLPFYIFTLEKKFREYERNPEKLEELKKVYEDILYRMDQLVKDGQMTAYEQLTLIDMMKRVLNGIARKYDKVRKGECCI